MAAVVAGRRSVYRQVRYLSVRRESEGQLPCCDVRAVSHLSVVQDLRDIAGDRSFKHVFLGVGVIRIHNAGVLYFRSAPSQVLRGVPAVRRSFLCDSGVGVFDTPPSQASPLVGVSNTPTPLRRKFPHVSQSVGDLASQARTRPAPGPHQARTRPAPGPHQARARVFSEVERLQCDSLDLTLGLTDFAGQKQDLRTMEPVAEIIGHCFVVGD